MRPFPRYYILDQDGNPVPVEDVRDWGEWFEANTEARIVARDRDEGGVYKEIWVSTVFLGLDHNYFDDGPPLLFETMVFGGPLEGQCDRYSTRAEALAGHQAMCRQVKEAISNGREATAGNPDTREAPAPRRQSPKKKRGGRSGPQCLREHLRSGSGATRRSVLVDHPDAAADLELK
jgi:hypothetical protein